jgi:hypothetical protein
MTTFFGDEISISYYRSSAARPMTTPAEMSTPAEASSLGTISSSKLLEGLEDKVQSFKGIADMRRAVDSRSKGLQAGKTTDQYLVFKPVTKDDLDKIDDQLGRHVRMTHCIDLDTLITKVLGAEHEYAHITFGQQLTRLSDRMGLPPNEFADGGGTRYQGRSSSKEADTVFKPATVRPNRTDWPTIVLEAGVSLPQLKNYAKWWLSNSGGQVRIVLIFSIKRGIRTIEIEKWENRPATTCVT